MLKTTIVCTNELCTLDIDFVSKFECEELSILYYVQLRADGIKTKLVLRLITHAANFLTCVYVKNAQMQPYSYISTTVLPNV